MLQKLQVRGPTINILMIFLIVAALAFMAFGITDGSPAYGQVFLMMTILTTALAIVAVSTQVQEWLKKLTFTLKLTLIMIAAYVWYIGSLTMLNLGAGNGSLSLVATLVLAAFTLQRSRGSTVQNSSMLQKERANNGLFGRNQRTPILLL